MNVYLCRYSLSSLIGDYLRSIIGLTIMVLLLTTIPLSPWIAGPIIIISVLFFVFLMVTLDRHLITVRVDNNAITVRHKKILWPELISLRLDYYTTRRDRSSGWMQLRLKGNHTTIRLDSRLEHFHDIVTYAADAARTNNLTLNRVTTNNLIALGILSAQEGALLYTQT